MVRIRCVSSGFRFETLQDAAGGACAGDGHRCATEAAASEPLTAWCRPAEHVTRDNDADGPRSPDKLCLRSPHGKVNSPHHVPPNPALSIGSPRLPAGARPAAQRDAEGRSHRPASASPAPPSFTRCPGENLISALAESATTSAQLWAPAQLIARWCERRLSQPVGHLMAQHQNCRVNLYLERRGQASIQTGWSRQQASLRDARPWWARNRSA